MEDKEIIELYWNRIKEAIPQTDNKYGRYLRKISMNILCNNEDSEESDAVAAYGIAYENDLFPIMLSVGLSQGVAPLMGYCYGVGQKLRLKKVMRYATIVGIILGGLFAVPFLTVRGMNFIEYLPLFISGAPM